METQTGALGTKLVTINISAYGKSLHLHYGRIPRILDGPDDDYTNATISDTRSD